MLFPGCGGEVARYSQSPDGSATSPLGVHKLVYAEIVNDDDSSMSVRDARAHLAEVITRAQNGSPTVITRNGLPVAAVVPIEDFNVLEDAIDRYFAREADRDLAEHPDARTYSMSEVVAEIFGEDTGAA
jgi:prevent-host-death family protein